MTHIEIIETSNPLYQQERILRNKVLLQPIGIPDFGWEMKDSTATHFVACKSNKVIGCVLLHPEQEQQERAQLMQMAVDPLWQSKGIGGQLIEELVSYCQIQGIKEVFCHSRANVVKFYQKLGFTTYGDPFEEVGIFHRKMRLQTANV